MLNDTEKRRLRFWRRFKAYAQPKGLRLRKPWTRHYYELGVGRTGFRVSLVLRQRKPAGILCELYITHEDADRLCRQLKLERRAIETEIGAKLAWPRMEGKKSRLVYQYRPADVKDQKSWPELFAWLEERARVFLRTFGKRVSRRGHNFGRRVSRSHIARSVQFSSV